MGVPDQVLQCCTVHQESAYSDQSCHEEALTNQCQLLTDRSVHPVPSAAALAAVSFVSHIGLSRCRLENTLGSMFLYIVSVPGRSPAD